MSPFPGNTETLLRFTREHSSSPLFARAAAAYLDADRPDDALKVALAGLRRHPGYATGLYVAAKAQVMLRRYVDARNTLDSLMRQMPGCRAARRLLDQLPTLELEYPPVPTVHSMSAGAGLHRSTQREEAHPSRRDDLLPGVEMFLRKKRRGPEDAALEQPTDAEDTKAEATSEFDILEVARRLEGARIPSLLEGEVEMTPIDESSPKDEVDLGSRPVTETLLSIYVQQGRLHEAAEGFRRLARQQPARADEFLRKAAELEGE